MNNNKICNPKTDVPSGTNLNDKDYLNSVLSLLKEMQKNYTIALTEASNEVLFGKYNNMYDNIKNLQRDVYELSFKKGWYTLEKAEENKVTEKYNTLNQEFIDLSV